MSESELLIAGDEEPLPSSGFWSHCVEPDRDQYCFHVPHKPIKVRRGYEPVKRQEIERNGKFIDELLDRPYLTPS